MESNREELVETVWELATSLEQLASFLRRARARTPLTGAVQEMESWTESVKKTLAKMPSRESHEAGILRHQFNILSVRLNAVSFSGDEEMDTGQRTVEDLAKQLEDRLFEVQLAASKMREAAGAYLGGSF